MRAIKDRSGCPLSGSDLFDSFLITILGVIRFDRGLLMPYPAVKGTRLAAAILYAIGITSTLLNELEKLGGAEK
jgi:hypothetical protein